MRLRIAYSKIRNRNLVLINNATYQRETLSERPIRQPLSSFLCYEALLFHTKLQLNLVLTAHNWQKWKSNFHTCRCHKIYWVEAFRLSVSNYTRKNTIFVNMWNLGQCREDVTFCQYLLNESSNLKILLHMGDTYNCNYLPHNPIVFNLIEFRLNTDFLSQFYVFYRELT